MRSGSNGFTIGSSGSNVPLLSVMALSFRLRRLSEPAPDCFDLDFFHFATRLGPRQIDREQPVPHLRADDFDALCEDEGALELPGCNSFMKKRPAAAFGLPSANDQLVFFHCDRKVAVVESSHSQSNPEPVRPVFLNVVG